MAAGGGGGAEGLEPTPGTREHALWLDAQRRRVEVEMETILDELGDAGLKGRLVDGTGARRAVAGRGVGECDGAWSWQTRAFPGLTLTCTLCAICATAMRASRRTTRT